MPTQKDIAGRLGVSVSLVSRVLGGRAREIGVSEETIRRIHDTASEMQYVPSAAARILKGAATQTVGVVVYDFEDPFFGPFTGALQREAHRLNYSLVLVGFDRRRVLEADLQPLLKHGLDGVISVGSEPVARWAGPFGARGIPVVRVGGGQPGEGVRAVCVDARAGLDLLLEHLAGLGHRRVGFVGSSLDVCRQRMEMFLEVAAQRGVETSPAWVRLDGRLPKESGPTALVASNDVVALGAVRGLHERGRRVPGEMSVVGFDDIPLARLTTPGLTTVRQPLEAMAAAAFELATRPDDAMSVVHLEPRLVVRESSAPPQGGDIQ